jgi:PST family polysaccharide transporter
LTEERASYRRILKSSSIIGGAAFATVLIGLLKMKAFALMLGPAGVGLFGVYAVLLALFTTLFGMGLNSSGVRELAVRTDDPEGMDQARWSLWLLTFSLALGGALVVLLLHEPITKFTDGGGAPFSATPLIALCVAISVIQASQMVVLQAFQRVAAVARVTFFAALLAAVAGIAAVALLGRAGVLIALIAAPAAGILVAFLERKQLPALGSRPPGRTVVFAHWGAFLRLGAAFVVTVMMHRAVEFGIRAHIVRTEGLDEAGLYQAAASISGNNVGLILAALAADYFPRLSALGGDRERAQDLVNQQVRVMLLLGGPLLIALVAAAPLALQVLYSSKFVPASPLLQYQAAGDALKLMTWALGYVLVVKGEAFRFALLEASFALVALILSFLFSERLGLEGYGIAWLCTNLLYTCLLIYVCRKWHGIAVAWSNRLLLGCYVLTALLLIGVASQSSVAALLLGGLASAAAAAFSVHQLILVSGTGKGGLLDRLRTGFRRFRQR